MSFTGTNNLTDFISYILQTQGWGDDKTNTVRRAFDVVCQSIIQREPWQFLQKEDNFTMTEDVATYDLSVKITGFTAQRILSVKVDDNAPLTYLSPEKIDEQKSFKDPGETEESGEVLYWTIRERGDDQVIKLEVWRAPSGSNSKLYVLWFKGLTQDVKDYLLEHWSGVLTAGVVASLQHIRRIVTPSGAIIEEGAPGVPDLNPRFETALKQMELNEPTIQTLDAAPGDSNWTTLYQYIHDIN